jgi:hypothetical protein
LVDPPQADFINESERDRNPELRRADSMESQLAEDRLGHFRGRRIAHLGIAKKFVDAINAHDVCALTKLMSSSIPKG